MVWGMQVDPDRRLGSGPSGADEIRSHPWFSCLDWALLQASLQPPGNFSEPGWKALICMPAICTVMHA